MKHVLEIGTLAGGKPFTLPLDFVARTCAIVGTRGAGKTVAATVIAEEMCEAGLPWVALDPVGVWWGLRCDPEGKPSGYPVVIIGGEHADLPLEKSMGPQCADAVLAENVSCVIDMSGHSKNTVRWFVTEFCDRLMERKPATPRHIFIEEAPELVPQKPMGEQKRSLAAVDRLIRLGRNRGYGATLISQRFATVNKDVLTQCENIVAMRCIGPHDRKAASDWIAEVVGFLDGSRDEEMVESLPSLASGTGWFWSPEWLHLFERIQIRKRRTYHPGETRTLGHAPKQVQLSDVAQFVERFSKVLQKPAMPTVEEVGAKIRRIEARHEPPAAASAEILAELAAAKAEGERLAQSLHESHQQVRRTAAALEEVRKALEPQYLMLKKVFGALDAAPGSAAGGADAAVWDPWKAKLGAGPAKVIDILLARGECTRMQLQTLSGYCARSLRDYISRLNSNGLIDKDGDKIRLRIP